MGLAVDRELSERCLYTWATACPMATMAPSLVVLIIEKQQGPWG